jgi:hypothetical protein
MHINTKVNSLYLYLSTKGKFNRGLIEKLMIVPDIVYFGIEQVINIL